MPRKIALFWHVEPPFPGGDVIFLGSDANPVIEPHSAIGDVAVEQVVRIVCVAEFGRTQIKELRDVRADCITDSGASKGVLGCERASTTAAGSVVCVQRRALEPVKMVETT